MMENIWTKAATAAFALLAILAGWGLNEVYHVEMRVVSIEAKLDIWMTPLPGGKIKASNEWAPDADHTINVSMPLRGEQGTEFAQKSMVRAAEQLLHKDIGGALQTLIVGLENTGLKCAVSGDHLECE